MITELNLSSKPFRNRTLPYLLASLLLVIAAIGGVFAFSTLNSANSNNKIVESQMVEMKTRVAELKEKGEQLRQQLTPDQQQLLIASHKLVANKSFGWSKLFADLEQVLPGSVSASRISVQKIFKDENKIKAELELSVLSRDYQSVDQMIGRMNGSGIFQAELRSQDFQKGETITYTEYTLFLIYAQPGIYTPQTSPEDTDEPPSMLNDIKAEKGGAE